METQKGREIIRRRLKILELIAQQPGITRREIQRKLSEGGEHWALRTIEGDVKYLLEHWEGGELKSRGRGLFIERLYRPLSESAARQEREKKVYIKLALDAVRNMEELSEMHDGLVRELHIDASEIPFYLKSESYEEIDTDDERIRELQEAIRQDHNIAFDYRGESFYVAPLRIVNFDGIWYLYGLDHQEREANRWKTWLLSEIENPEIYYDERHDIADSEVEEDLEEAFSPLFVPDREICVRVRVRPPATKFFRLREQLPRQRIVAEEGEALIVESLVSTFADVEAEIKSFLPHVEVLSPNALREKILSELRDYLERMERERDPSGAQ